eukprot:6435174-Lingulodinium_polyedra.AAC.1
MPGFAGVLDLAYRVLQAFPGYRVTMATEDFDGAFTQVPLHEAQRAFSYYHVMGPSGQVVYFLHLAGWFGPKLMPRAWCRAIAL